MTINKFIKVCSKEGGPVGDLAKGIIKGEDFPFVESNEDVLIFLESKTNMAGLNDVFQKFKNLFEKSK